jgi:hypothetical protein
MEELARVADPDSIFEFVQMQLVAEQASRSSGATAQAARALRSLPSSIAADTTKAGPGVVAGGVNNRSYPVTQKCG